MSTVITGASGHLGQLVVEQLLATGTPPTQLVATGRDINALADFANAGVAVRRADFTDQLPMITQYRALLGSAHDGLVSAASRADYAAAAVAVLTQDGHLSATYELGGTPFTLTELAATISDVLGTYVAYQDMSVADYTSTLTAAGLPPEMAAAVADADADAGLARGELFTASEDLVNLIGRPATTAHEAVHEAVRNAASMAASR